MLLKLLGKVLLQRLDAINARLDRLIAQVDAVQDDVRHVQSCMPDGDSIEARLGRIEAHVLDLSSGSVADDGSSSDGSIHE